jgi:hypothetical protein
LYEQAGTKFLVVSAGNSAHSEAIPGIRPQAETGFSLRREAKPAQTFFHDYSRFISIIENIDWPEMLLQCCSHIIEQCRVLAAH